MATVAIIHAAEDTLPARALAEKLRQAKLTVVLEKQPGEDQRGALKDAKVTVALWSPRSTAQQPLIDDAVYARGKSKLIHALMQNAAAPGQFSGDAAVNLTGWRGEDDFKAWRDLAKLVTDKAGVSPLPPPAPRAPSPFFTPGIVNPQAEAAAAAKGPQPGQPRLRAPGSAPAAQSQRPAPRQQAPRPTAAAQPTRQSPPRPAPATAPRQTAAQPAAAGAKPGGGAGLMIGIAAVVVLAIAGGGYYFFSQSQSANSTSAAWESVSQNDASALRAFIDGNPGEFRDDAEAALAALEDRSFEAASDTDTIEALETFLNDFPESEHAIVARGRIAELQTLQPSTDGETTDELPPTEAAPDPDLVPPNATAPGGDAGPAAITPPAAPSDSTPPDDAPTN